MVIMATIYLLVVEVMTASTVVEVMTASTVVLEMIYLLGVGVLTVLSLIVMKNLTPMILVLILSKILNQTSDLMKMEAKVT